MPTPTETISRYFAAIRRKDSEDWCACFAADGIAHDPADAPARQGRAAHRQFFEGVAGLFDDLDFRAGAAFVCGNQAAVHFTARCAAKNGNVAEVAGIDVFVFDADGLIASLHGYWDPTPLFVAAGAASGAT